MDVATLLSAVQTLFASLQCLELKELCSILGYKSKLEKLEDTVNTVKTGLLDAESKQAQFELLGQDKLWIQRLKNVVYDADDLIEELVTLAEQKKRFKGCKVSQKVRLLFSGFNFLAIAFKITRAANEIRKRLDAIASDHNQFGFKLDCQPARRRGEETCSYVYTKDIIGREDDLEKIVDRLLYTDVQDDVSSLAIVGLGGLGKTTLAQLVYNDTRIEKKFSLRLWACISDQDSNGLDLKASIRKILQSGTGESHKDLGLEPLQKRLQKHLEGKKCLLVLDDVWNESREQWLNLKKFLTYGQKGSWIVVTTRSEKTATIIEDKHPYYLKGLSEDDSWHLFEMMAFGERHEQAYPPDLIEIGREIVKKCANVPLAIRVVGSLLYDQGKEKWQQYLNFGLGRLKEVDNRGIEPILKLSYYHLDFPLKMCFSYCALFPKNHVIKKDKLIDLWMAQDYIVPQEGQSVEDTSEEYLLILVKRCFFQDVRTDEFGNIVSCKIHDLMHDIAQEVAGQEMYESDYFTTNLNNKVRHLSYLSIDESKKISFSRSKIRTCLCVEQYFGHCPVFVDSLVKNWVHLRVLDLKDFKNKALPSALKNLLHLRYLDLSWSEIEELPNSISKLQNLQTLRLGSCMRLKKLPKDLPELVKLRVLDIGGCMSLDGMPRGMGKMICLHKLDWFVVGSRNSTFEPPMTLKQLVVDQMEDLAALTKLKGKLVISILENTKYAEENVREGGYIRNKEHLNLVTIAFPETNSMLAYEQELLLENLQPPCNIRELIWACYRGMRIPSWAKDDNLATLLPNLVKIYLYRCKGLQHLPSMRRLCFLKSLVVGDLDEVEYIEKENRRSMGIMSDGAGASQSETFFPSLKELTLRNLPKLKGWWRDDEVIDSQGTRLLPSFPCLSKLTIQSCPNLTWLPACPTVEGVALNGNFKKLWIGTLFSKLSVRTSNAEYLKSASAIEAFQCLRTLKIRNNQEMESLSEVEEVFRSCSSSLRELQIRECPKLKSMSGGLEHLTALEELILRDLPELNMSKVGEREGEGEEEDGMPWRCLQSLRILKLDNLPKMVKLPKGMRYLTALQSLEMCTCKELESVPEWMRELTSLKTLVLFRCSDALTERCREGTGEDWPNIRHIPQLEIDRTDSAMRFLLWED